MSLLPPRYVLAKMGGCRLPLPIASHTQPVWLAKASWLQVWEGKCHLPSDRLHSQVTTEVIFAFTHFFGAVGQESHGL